MPIFAASFRRAMGNAMQISRMGVVALLGVPVIAVAWGVDASGATGG